MAVKCIYCENESERPVRGKASTSFRRHSESSIAAKATLPCTPCVPDGNSYFGRKLEQHFGRDTGDAFLRLLTGLKPANEAHEIGGRRLTFKVDEPESEHYGEWVILGL